MEVMPIAEIIDRVEGKRGKEAGSVRLLCHRHRRANQ